MTNTEQEWIKVPASSINIRLDDSECFIRIPWADDYEFIGPMPVEMADMIIADHVAQQRMTDGLIAKGSTHD